ncbi:MAG TPA: hypothetical protein VK487_01955 [Candidatus Bathyarchaeia archaeon]|nr:hypothetical protein [Candidatus Bathyarchaeia archaeon]
MPPWEHVGYVGWTRSGAKIKILLKHQLYVVDPTELRKLLEERPENYIVLIYEPPREEKKGNDEHSEAQPSANRSTTPPQLA